MTFRLKPPEPRETQVLAAVLYTLQHDARVGNAWRMNTGGAYLSGRKGPQFVRFGFKGSPDIYAYMADGRALYVEVKRPSGRVSPEQQAFLEEAARHGCVAFVARSIDEVMRGLEAT